MLGQKVVNAQHYQISIFQSHGSQSRGSNL